jgi:hypothetical protein
MYKHDHIIIVIIWYAFLSSLYLVHKWYCCWFHLPQILPDVKKYSHSIAWKLKYEKVSTIKHIFDWILAEGGPDMR